MPVYANQPLFADRRAHPRALTAIVLVHAVAIAAVMTAKMDLPVPFIRTPTKVELIPLPKEPPPPEPQPKKPMPPPKSVVDHVPAVVPVPTPDPVPLDLTPMPLPLPTPGDLIGPAMDPAPQPQPTPRADPVRVGPRFVTPAEDLRPPYPNEKRRLGEEASLRLRLSIDARGRVVAVEPVGQADRAFLEAARRHLIAHWRYRPASEDGKAVPSHTVITLRFELED